MHGGLHQRLGQQALQQACGTVILVIGLGMVRADKVMVCTLQLERPLVILVPDRGKGDRRQRQRKR
jgi:hypothetical protein